MTKNSAKATQAPTASTTDPLPAAETAAPESAAAETTPAKVTEAAAPSIDELRAQGLSAVRLPIDTHHNKGGTFVMRGGVRVPL